VLLSEICVNSTIEDMPRPIGIYRPISMAPRPDQWYRQVQLYNTKKSRLLAREIKTLLPIGGLPATA